MQWLRWKRESDYGVPEIVTTDRGSQFTSTASTEAVLGRGIAPSMDGKASWRNNVFVERLWRNVEYEKGIQSLQFSEPRRESMADLLSWYNQHRPHSRSVGTDARGLLRKAIERLSEQRRPLLTAT